MEQKTPTQRAGTDRSILEKVSYLNEYYYSFNDNPNYEAILELDRRIFRANVLTNPAVPHGVATLEVWNTTRMDWSHVHTIPGSLMRTNHDGVAREGFREDFADDVAELLTVGLSVVRSGERGVLRS